jgi:broad specificity phosphatase PhoE
MGAIYLVRHGQAAFGTDDYDRLTPTGFMQARLLGAYFGLRKIRFDAVYTGTLRRHGETAQGIFEGSTLGNAPGLQRRAGLDEYNSEALVLALKASKPRQLPLPCGAIRQ